MAKAEWGTKRTCHSCGARFYDLHRDPIVCPVCGTAFDPERHPRMKRTSAVSKDEPAAATLVADSGTGAELQDKSAGAIGAADAEEVDIESIDDTEADDNADLETADEESNDLIEDTSELGEDDDDIGEVLEHVNDDLDDNV